MDLFDEWNGLGFEWILERFGYVLDSWMMMLMKMGIFIYTLSFTFSVHLLGYIAPHCPSG